MKTALFLAALLYLPWLPGGLEGQEGSREVSAVERVEAWGRALGIQPGVISEMAHFREGDRTLDPQFGEAQAQRIRRAALASVRNHVDRVLEEGCVPSVDVDFPEPETWGAMGLSSIQERFLSGMVRTVAVACFSSDATPREALELYTSPSFRMKAESRIERMWNEDQKTCIRTGGVPVLLSPTELCNEITLLLEPDLAVEHSQTVRNTGTGGTQPVYFKESFKTFIQTPDGLAFHYVNYSRSVDLGRASRWIAGGKIEDSQERQVEALRRRIGG